jgi:acetyl esterase/lipase
MTNRRDFLIQSAASAVAVGADPFMASSFRPFSEPQVTVDSMDFVNPELRLGLQQASQFLSGLTYSDTSLPRLRQLMRSWDVQLDAPAVTEHLIPAAKSDPDVRVYATGISPGSSRPAILHIHGGGFIAFRAKDSLRAIQNMAIAHNCVVVTVDYRLAPETRFPGALEDIYAALRWMYRNAKDLGVNPKGIAVKGESAGATYAALLAIAVRDRKEFSLCLQILLYPTLDDRTGSTRHLPEQFGKYVWNPQANQYAWTSLLGVAAGSRHVPENAAPARVRDLSGLAPLFIGVGSIDLSAPENIEYAQRMMMAGNAVELVVVPGAYHAFDILAPDASITRQFVTAWNEAIRRAFTIL